MTTFVRCHVVGCNRTKTGSEFDEWICAKHWPLTDIILRRRYFRMKRYAKRNNSQQAWKLHAMIWEALKRQARDRAHGI